MNMIFRKAVVTGILIVLGIASAGAVMALYVDYSVKAAAASLPSGLSRIPSDYKLVFGINVQKFAQSSALSKFHSINPAGNDLALFAEKTGLDPMRDISYLVGAANGKNQARNRGVVIVSGKFNKDAIVSYIRSKAAPIEQEYRGALVMMMPEPNSNEVQKGIVFLSSQEIALGDLESLKMVLDINGQEMKSVVYSDTMAPLLQRINTDEMFWFAGDAAGVPLTAPANAPIPISVSSIKGFVGAMNIGDAVTGRITATAVNPDGALKLADAARGLIALGQLAGNGNQQADIKLLLGGITVSQEASEVSIALNFPSDLLARMGQSRSPRVQ
jgi:hypothetical protein